MSGHNFSSRSVRCVSSLVIASLLGWAQLPAILRADEVPAPAGKSLASAPATKVSQERIQQLIKELGNPRYTVRRAAANDLRQIGAEAFDSLHAATEDADPEIAASANYLLRQIAVRWVQPDDTPLVRSVMRQYAQEAEAARILSVEQLARLPQGGGLGALCRIARFDRSPLVSRTAAIAIIRPKDAAKVRPAIDATLVEQQLGASTRIGAVWLHQYVAQVRDPAASIPNWKQLVDQETARLEKSGETSNDIIIRLQWNLAELYRQVGDQPAIIALLDRMVELAGDTSDETIVNLLVWLTGNKSWDVLDAFLAKNQPQMEQSKRPLYYAAMARAKQGKQEDAEKLASSAAEIHTQDSFEGVATARDLEEHGHFEWAVREYRRAIDKQPLSAVLPMIARISLASLLHDHEREKDAADVVEPLVKAVQGNGQIAQEYAKLRESYGERVDLPKPDAIAARYHFYRACQYEAENDLSRARGELDLAINFDEEDADVLIAMYHFPEADPKWRDSVKQKLRQLIQDFQQKIDEDPSNPSPYNQWAWLVSNTEGDFQKAIRYSYRSLELNAGREAGEASFLDTLGRCYFAAGDYENAVKYERMAVAKIDYMQVMQRQLAEFEKALADKKAPTKESNAEKPK